MVEAGKDNGMYGGRTAVHLGVTHIVFRGKEGEEDMLMMQDEGTYTWEVCSRHAQVCHDTGHARGRDKASTRRNRVTFEV